MIAIIGAEPDWRALPAATSLQLRRLLPRLLHKDPKRRVRDIADTRLDLEDVQSAQNDEAFQTRSVAPWRRVALVSSTMLALTLVAGASWLLRRDSAASLPIGGHAIATQLTSYDGSEGAAAIAPDGRSFAFVSSRGGTPDIWLRQVSGGEPDPVTD